MTAVNQRSPRADGEYVLYWMVATRRTGWSFALQHSLSWCERLGRPLLVFEPLRAGYQWASDRLHRFIIDGMRDNAAGLERAGITSYHYVEPRPGAGAGLLQRLAERACIVVTDEYPAFFIPHMVSAAGKKLDVSLEQVDGNGIIPLRAPGRSFTTAASFRRVVQRLIPAHIASRPISDPLAASVLPEVARGARVPAAVESRWERARLERDRLDWLSSIPIDHEVAPAPQRGGPVAAEERWRTFLAERLQRYPEEGRHPDAEATSGLSPYLHFGHIGAHQLVHEILEHESWTPASLPPKPTGSRDGGWGASQAAEAFLDQLVVWRELGFNHAFVHPDSYRSYGSLPRWARKTLEEHSVDTRATLYRLDQLERAETHDALWNAAQRQLLQEGAIQNYLRMLWGKLIVAWTPTPEMALERMFVLNDRFALDGRDPNSASGILWTLGLFDRAWGPERPIFGKVRYMSTASSLRKLKLKSYLERYGTQGEE